MNPSTHPTSMPRPAACPLRAHCAGPVLCALLASGLAVPARVDAQQAPPPCHADARAETSLAVTGRITDTSTGAVRDAEVSFARDGALPCGATRLHARTDANGLYRITAPPGTYEMLVVKPGFDPGFAIVTVAQAEATRQHDMTLDVAQVTEDVTVTAGGFEQLVRQAPASVSVVPRADLEERRFATIAEALVDVEGVDVGQNVGKTGGLTISMRGMPSDYTLFLIDGRRQNAAGNVTPNGFTETATSFMPPVGAIERIEVVRGPMSTLYGSDAMGGVVNIITRKVWNRWGGTGTIDGTLQSDRSYGDTTQGTAYVSGPLLGEHIGITGRTSAYHREAAALRYEAGDGQDVPITSFGLSPTRADVRTAGGRLMALPHRNHDLSFDVDAAWQAYDNSERQLGTLGVQGGYQDELRFERQQYVAAHTARLGTFLVDSSLMRNTTATTGRTIPPGTPGRGAGDPRTLEATNTILDSKLIVAKGRHTLSVGGQWWDAHMVDAVAPAPYDFTQGALFAENEWRVSPTVSLTLGARYDDHSTFGGNTSPRAYAVYTPHPSWTVKGGVSRGFKTPRLEQLAEGITGFGAQGTLPFIGSPGLRPETSTSTELAAFFVRGALSVNVGVFNNTFQDKIANGPGLENCSFRGAPNRPGCVDVGSWPNVDLFGQSINVDEAVTRGVEGAVRLAFLSRWHLLTNYTYTDSEQRSGTQAGLPLVNTPRHMFNANLRLAATERLASWLRVEARSSRTRGTSAAAVAAREALGDFKPYGLVHLGGSYTLLRNVTLNATVFNLLDTDFLAYEAFTLNGQTQYASPYNNLQEPLRFWASLNVTF